MVVSIARHSEVFLAARFPFDREIVDAMSTVPDRRWSGGGQVWLIPNGGDEGDRLLDALYLYAQIQPFRFTRRQTRRYIR